MQDLGEALLRLAMRHSPVGVMVATPGGVMLAVNEAAGAMLGYAPDELVGARWQDITHPDDLAIDVDLVEATLAGERASYRLSKRYVRKDGEVLWGDLCTVALLRDDEGRRCTSSPRSST